MACRVVVLRVAVAFNDARGEERRPPTAATRSSGAYDGSEHFLRGLLDRRALRASHRTLFKACVSWT
jgi:hypothetical protein